MIRRVSMATMVVASVACHPSTPSAPTPAGAKTTGPAPRARAQQFVERQLAALANDDQRGFVATFVPDAILLGGSVDEIGKANPNVIEAILDLSPHDELDGVRLVGLVAGGTDRAVWIGFDLEVAKTTHEDSFGHEKYIVRGTELIAASADWKAVAAAIARPREPGMEREPTSYQGSTAPGPLAHLLADAARAERALDAGNDVVVVGASEDLHASGPAARQLLDQLAMPKMQLVRVGREIATPDWGYAQALLELPPLDRDPHRPRYELGQLLALPDGQGGWRVGAVHFVAD